MLLLACLPCANAMLVVELFSCLWGTSALSGASATASMFSQGVRALVTAALATTGTCDLDRQSLNTLSDVFIALEFAPESQEAADLAALKVHSDLYCRFAVGLRRPVRCLMSGVLVGIVRAEHGGQQVRRQRGDCSGGRLCAANV